ncbi:MAG: catalase [Planctomycetes bacterium]|nr:catalase [Planctomycetota bacterium]
MKHSKSKREARGAGAANDKKVRARERKSVRAGPAAAGPSQTDSQALEPYRERAEDTVLTTDQGIPIPHTDDSLKGGVRGPTLLEDFHLREKIMRFDHERIPERVVHARGSGAHGFFQVYESLAHLTCAEFLCDPTVRTPVFVRFSTVVGSRGSADTARDVRGFATKFYTSSGNFDLVGNNMPVFFIQDGLKFPDLVHAVKPEPHHEMPQAASAHDTFWDFVSLVPETMHMVMWVMSDRALPRSYRMMDGFGVHTFRLVDARGNVVFCKFHWKAILGAHALLWDEAQELAGRDPDFHRRDLWDSIEAGNFPEYELGLQVIEERDQLAYGFDLLDPTKLLPEELVPVQRVGKLTLNRNPDNFFAETEQVAFCVGNVVPGIDFTDDPLLQARLFSYLDTQLTRLGGPNFAEIPINRPHAPVHNHQQDGSSRARIPTGRALYHPNSIDRNMPALSAPHPEGFEHRPEALDGRKTRERSPSFLDHFSQARLFLRSQSAPERAHLRDALRFELAKVERLAIRERVVTLLRQVDEDLALEVARSIGVSFDTSKAADAPAPARGVKPARKLEASAALSLSNSARDSIRTRKVGVLLADGVRGDDLDAVAGSLRAAGAVVELIGESLGRVRTVERRSIEIDRTLATSASVFYDAVYVPGGAASIASLVANASAVRFVREACSHAKTIGATHEGLELLAAAGVVVEPSDDGRASGSHGIVTATAAPLRGFGSLFIEAIQNHRHYDRPVAPKPR